MDSNKGYEEGEVCGRDNCAGIIMHHLIEGCCSCHNNPPCSYCTTPKAYCETCGWDEYEENAERELATHKAYIGSQSEKNDIDFRAKQDAAQELFIKKMRGEISFDKIEYTSIGHTNSSMIKEGGFPEGTTKSDVLSHVNGSWGGTFEYFDYKNCKFKFIAYTD